MFQIPLNMNIHTLDSNYLKRLSENFVKALKIDRVGQIPSCPILGPILVTLN